MWSMSGKRFPSSIVLRQLVYISHLKTFYFMVKSLYDFGGLRLEDLEGVMGYDGINILQCNRTNVVLQLKDKFAYFKNEVHYFAHKTNLVVFTLSKINLVCQFEYLIQNFYAFFAYSSNFFWNSKSLLT